MYSKLGRERLLHSNTTVYFNGSWEKKVSHLECQTILLVNYSRKEKDKLVCVVVPTAVGWSCS